MFHFGGPGMDFPELGRHPFNTQYKAFSVYMMPGQERHDVERGGKIIMPPSALDTLTRLNIVYPMLFKLSNQPVNRVTHCGVLEFIADENNIYLPHWMMRNLCLSEGQLVRVESTALPVATYSKFQAQHVDFLDIHNPKAVLENALRTYACLTQGDVIAIKYNDRTYELSVIEVKPSKAVSIIECDMNVEFESPIGYKEPDRSQASRYETDSSGPSVEAIIEAERAKTFSAFSGAGRRLDGRKKGTEFRPNPRDLPTVRRGIPNYDYVSGTLTFIRNPVPITDDNSTTTVEPEFSPFSGSGRKLREPKATKRKSQRK